MTSASLFVSALLLAVAVVAYNMYGSLTLTLIPPGRMSVLSFIGLKDLQRGAVTGEALKAPAMLAYLLASLGLGEFTATKGAALLWLAALPFAGGLLGYAATKSKLVGGAAALLLSLIPLGYLPASGGDNTYVSALVLVQYYALFGLLLLGRSRLAPAWFALAVLSAVLIGLDVRSASLAAFAMGLAWASYSVYFRRLARSIVVALPGMVALGTSVLSAPDPTEALRTASSITTLSQVQVLLVILGVAGLGGAAALAYRRRAGAVPVLSYVAAGLVLVPFFGAEALLLVFPGVVVRAMVPLWEAKGLLRSVAEPGEGGRGQVVVEVHFEKLVAFAFAVIMLSSPFVTGFGPGAAVQGANYLGSEELQTISQVRTLDPSIFGQGLVAAPASIAPWLRAELGVNTILALTPNSSSVADAVTSTSFRLKNPYVMADEWTPFSSARTPFVYAFDGSIYGAVLHFDDGENRVNLTSATGTRTEDMSSMYMLRHSFSRTSSGMKLTMDLTKAGFNVTKSISMATGSPGLNVTYDIVPNFGTPTSVALPVYIEGTQTIATNGSGDTIRLSTPSVAMTLTFPGGSAPKLVHGTYQDYVQSTFLASGGRISASVLIQVQSAKSSGAAPFYSSFVDAARTYGISSLLTFAPQPGLDYLGTSAAPGMSLDIKDAFDRVLYFVNGSSRIESAVDSRVVSQSVSNSSCAARIDYATAGLNIEKRVASGNDSVSMVYSISSRSGGATLREANMTFWIPFGRALLGYGSNSTSLQLRLDSGNVTITPTSGRVTSVTVGPDPTYGQLRAVMTFALGGSTGSAGATMDFGRQVSCQEVLSSRPIIHGTDELQLFTKIGALTQVFSNEFFTVYQLSARQLPP